VRHPDNYPPQFLDLFGKLGISSDPPAHHIASMQHRGVVAVKPTPDLLQTRALQHLKAQQHRGMPGTHDVRQVSPTEKLRARQIELLGDDVLNERR
jgi:hypothetical protein